MCRRHFDLLVQSRGERTASNLIRKHFGWYIKGFPGASAVRKQLVTAKNRQEMLQILDSLEKDMRRYTLNV